MAAALLVAGFVSAQATFGVNYIGVKETNKVTLPIVGTTTTNHNLSGFAITFDDNINIAGGLNFAPGASLAYANRKYDSGKGTDFDINVPLLLNYGFDIADGLKLSVFAGPEINFGLVSKWKSDNGNTEIDYYDDDNYKAKRLGLGVQFGAWLDINDLIRLRGGYNMGLTNMTGLDNCDFKSNYYYVGVAYIF